MGLLAFQDDVVGVGIAVAAVKSACQLEAGMRRRKVAMRSIQTLGDSQRR
jgi:hypothetical protein